MRRHIKHSSLDRALYPQEERNRMKFNPVEVPILNMLAVEVEKKFGWNYPSAETIRTYQDYRGLSTSMLRHCKTKEILLNGNQREKEQRDIISWYQDRMAENNAAMPNSPLSLDVEQVRFTLKDVLRLAEQVPYDRSSVVLSNSPGTEYYGAHKDRYVQLPIRVMIGNRITWALMIMILTNPKRDGYSRKRKHTIEKLKVPEYVTELLVGMPFVTGFGIKGDVLVIVDTFSLMVGRDLKLSGFV